MKNPKLIVKPFAKNGQKNVIPENYETSMESNQATWDQGFGQITMLPVAAGGLPPKGQDFNGIFNQLSENIVYLSQGGRFKFSAEYAESIGGYPKGAILQSDDEKKEYLSLIDNNKVNFNVAPDISASWEVIGGSYATKAELANGLNKKVNTSDVSQTLGNGLTKLPSLDLVTRELGKKASTADVNGKLAKDQNGADIPDKPKFIENLGLKEVFQPKGNYAPTGNYAYKGDSYTKAESDNNYQPKGSYQAEGYSYSKTESDNKYQPKGQVVNENTASKAKNGWWQCGDTGIIFQSMHSTFKEWGEVTVNFPKPFPGACMNVTVSINSETKNPGQYVLYVRGWTNSGVTVYAGGMAAGALNIIAMGY